MQQIALSSTPVRVTLIDASVAIAQGHGGQLYLGNTAYSPGDATLNLVDNIPISFNTADFSHVWVFGYGVANFAG